ncbi:BON domain-containing protein [Nitrosomonas ureae]|uniref:BON domain-containing protein n=1 Tax=Nitrosomonas ureae TaxID=44577 RepID=A0A1H9F8W1_9PROT|nr:BON domain-containing protein [Nitrosomonas ureae]SEQ33738.1 BON domain-containing protein [Nitrosomonas ureae]
MKLAKRLFDFLRNDEKRMIYIMRHVGTMGYLLMILSMTSCAGFNPGTIEETPREDIILAMKIKAKLIEAEELKAAAIHVEATNGSVKISGFVETESQRQLASSIIQQFPDVKQVNNQLKVK